MLDILQNLTITEEKYVRLSKREKLYIIKVSQDLFWLEFVSTDSVAIRGTGGRYISLVELVEVCKCRSVQFD